MNRIQANNVFVTHQGKSDLNGLLDENNKKGKEANTGQYGSIISKWQFSKVELSLDT